MLKRKLFVLLFLIGVSFSETDELEKLLDFALKNNPAIKSYSNLRSSFLHKAEFSRSLPNPTLSLSLNNLDTERYIPHRKNPMSGFGIYLSQKYLLPVKREKTSQIFLQKSSEVEIMEEKFKKELFKKLKILYWDFAYSFEMERILLKTKEEIEFLKDITEEKFRYGKALLSDLLLLKVELLKVDENLARAERLREATIKRIHALAGGTIDLKGSPLKVPAFPSRFLFEKNSDVLLQREKLKTLKAQIERAKVEHYPDLTLSAGYTIRPDIPNLITLKVGFTLPVWKEKRENMLVLEAQEKYNYQLLQLKDTELKVRGEFNALRESYRITRKILQTVEEEIEEKKKEIETLLLAYRYEKTDIREILRAYRILWDLELKKAQLLKELNQITARAEALQ